MKAIKKQGAQGELTFLRIESVPKGWKELRGDAARILGHSETGHHHVLASTEGLRVFAPDDNPFVCCLLLETTEHADVEHLRAHDTHDTVRMLGGTGAVWQVTRGREFTPEGERLVQD